MTDLPATEPTPVDRPHYRAPGLFTRAVFNRLVAALTRAGVSVLGSRVLEVRGRTSGQPRRTPVNLLALDGREYLVSPRGHTQWVRNARAAGGELDLLLGRRRAHYRATELADEEKVPVLRAYLRRWKAEVGVFFGGVGPDSSDEELAAIAHRHPAFVLERIPA
ncbi:nitroreductase family deazaflavin-dependent oxidoreductase [Frankia sp. CNm7]|uniref:Nitroreductase family deazaflavin-dependent oxidoreductase n=1 Tax=Frankia nepalensis TaxID=1836974 RepID=A0A937RP34_9ACTN|nr:nitroreductase/quinone reductase family protein [Frankia nepalensis]MBL7500681.1 nitroreductase family deazaflavin-dependent oxidoreductase [Frankia nepalensis]MBL7513133.1 nitroreductase family deazaflavin-dependent oxidoreductase [Frankia nepalensis]MBL7522812.1 nitroreductase family deazaflavin-dependent oxidoreductase [Frankia nepalensis]MBL7633592.1 nitroreductase family deazaflavin-dependent oxidoreductase [Frankia nepalensis]